MPENVIRGKPDFKKLAAQGYVAVDMHTHTRFSDDAFTPVWQIIDRAKRLGIGIAITDHNEIRGALKASKNKRGVLVIPGIELKFQRNMDILCYFYSFADLEKFYERYVEPRLRTPLSPTNIEFIDLPAEQFFAEIKDIKFISSIAHPFVHPAGAGILMDEKFVSPKLFDLTDYIEVFNGHLKKHTNDKAQTWRTGKIFTGGSDSHFSFSLGSAVTAVKINGQENFLDSLRRGTIVMGQEQWYPSTLLGFFLGLVKISYCNLVILMRKYIHPQSKS